MTRLTLIDRYDAADELTRIIEVRKLEYPRLVAAGTLPQAQAARRNDRLAAAWAMVIDPSIAACSPNARASLVALACELIDARRLPSQSDLADWLRQRDADELKRKTKR